MERNIGSNTEKKASKKLRLLFGKNAYIKKIPDFKQTGSISGGLPDYIVISNGRVLWFEVKHIDNKKKSISFRNFTDQQVIEFRRMIDAKTIIYVMIYFGNELYIVKWKRILNYMKNSKNKSIPKKNILRWNENV